MQPRYALHRQGIGVHRLYDIRSLIQLSEMGLGYICLSLGFVFYPHVCICHVVNYSYKETFHFLYTESLFGCSTICKLLYGQFCKQ